MMVRCEADNTNDGARRTKYSGCNDVTASRNKVPFGYSRSCSANFLLIEISRWKRGIRGSGSETIALRDRREGTDRQRERERGEGGGTEAVVVPR